MINATGSTALTDAISRSPKTKVTRPPKVIQQPQHQQLNPSNTQNLQAIITPQGLPNRKLAQATQQQYINDNHQQILLAKSSQGNAVTVGQRRQSTLQAGNIPNQTIILNQQQRQLLQQQIQGGQRAQDTNTKNRILEILTQANVPQEQKDNNAANNLPATVVSTSGVRVQPIQNTRQVSSSQLVSVKNSSGSVAEVKNAASPPKKVPNYLQAA